MVGALRIVIGIMLIGTILDEVVAIALLFHVAHKIGSSLAIAWLLLAQALPAIALAPYGGIAVDRFGAKRTIVLAAVPQAALMVLLGTAETTPWLVIFTVGLSSCFAFSGPALFALVPVVARQARFTVERTNSMIEIARGLGSVLGPVVGGTLIGYLEFATTLQMVAIWSLALPAAVVMFGLNTELSREKGSWASAFLGVGKSYKPILRRRAVVLIVATFGAIVFSTTFSDVVFIFFASFDLGASAFLVGILMASWAAGLTMGAWYCGKGTGQRPGLLGLAYLGGAVMGVALLTSGVAAILLRADLALAAVAAIFLVGGMGNGVHNVAVRNAIHSLVPAGQHGRAFSFYVAVSRAASICGYFGGGLVGASNAIVAYLASGILACSAAGLGWMAQKKARASESSI